MQTVNTLIFKTWHKYFISIFLIIIFYIPNSLTISYIKFRITNRGVLNWGGYEIRMNNGWFPYDFNTGLMHPHITWIKINPWIPGSSPLARLDMICYRDFIPKNSYYFQAYIFQWGNAYFYKDKNFAFTQSGKLRIYFDHKADLNEIVEIKYVNHNDTLYCRQSQYQ